MKAYIKKSFIIFMSFLIVITSVFIKPQYEVNAAVLAVPAAATTGAAVGAYVLGAMAVGGIATAVGIEYGDDISKHAHNVWNTSTDLAKQAVDHSIQSAKDRADHIATLGSSFWDWTVEKAGAIAGAVTAGGTMAKNLADSAVNSVETTLEGLKLEGEEVIVDTITVNTAYPEVNFNTSYYTHPYIRSDGSAFLGNFRATLTFPENSLNAFALTTNEHSLVQFRRLYIQFSSGELIITANDFASDLGTNSFPTGSRSGNIVNHIANTKGVSNTLVDLSYNESVALFRALVGARTVEELLGVAANIGLDNIGVGSAETWEIHNQVVNQILSRDLPIMQDAGMVIPLGEVVALGSTGQTLTRNPADTAYLNPDGTVYTGNPTYTIPSTRVVTTATGNPAIVTTVAGNPVDVMTGNPVITTTPGTPGTGERPNNPSQSLMNLVTTKFPFSLPWDLLFILSFFLADPKTPRFEVDQEYMGMPFYFEHEMSYLDSYIEWFRAFIVLGFCMFLVLSTRKLVGGAE